MNTKTKFFIIGVVAAIIAPLLMDWVLFGTPTPCKTIKSFEDGSSIQACSVRR